MSNFFKFLLLSTFLYGAVDNSFAGCPPNELERSNPREIITNTPIYNAGKLVAIGRGEEVLLIARDRDGKIVGITDAQTNRAINLADLLASATDKSVSGISKPEWDPCGGMGGDSFVLDMGVEKLRLVEVDGSRAAEPPYWQPILAPAFPSDAELGAVPMDNNQTERNKRCEGQKNQCLAAVEGDWKSGSGLAAAVCFKAGDMADRYLNKNKYGKMIGVATVIACSIAHDNYVEAKRKTCNDQFAACLVGP